jgi:UDP:flavonoid glycosyltransferase YjiC (YdhE family)
MKKVLLTTIGTLGDLNPLIALAKLLNDNGIETHIAACSAYRPNVEREGIAFHEIAPHYDPKSEELCKAILHPLKTLPYFFRKMLSGASLKQSIDEFNKLVPDYDLVIGNVFSFSARIACHLNKVKWASMNLSPTCFFSKYDPPVLYPITFLNRLSFGREFIFSLVYKYIFKLADYWGRDIHKFYKENNLKGCGNLLRNAPFSDSLNIAMYSRVLGKEQRDWPKNTTVTGFLFYSAQDERCMNELDKFIADCSEKPILITFGSTAGFSFESYFEKIISAVNRISKKYKRPIIITMDKKSQEKWKSEVSENIYLCDYLPYTKYMDKMEMVVHQGGIGTLSPAIKAGIPQIVLPGCTDQFDNAYRLKNLGVGESIPLKKLSENNLFETISNILETDKFYKNCLVVKTTVESEQTESKLLELIKKNLGIINT